LKAARRPANSSVTAHGTRTISARREQKLAERRKPARFEGDQQRGDEEGRKAAFAQVSLMSRYLAKQARLELVGSPLEQD
jgi:hypothetical protein